MPPSVRRATKDDAGEVARLLHDFNSEFGDFTPGVEALTARLAPLIDGGDATALLGGDGPDGVAVVRFRASLWVEALEAYLEELYVAPERRREGIGRALLERVIELAREVGANYLHLGTSEDDTAAIGLYESAGFTNREGRPDGPVMLFYELEL